MDAGVGVATVKLSAGPELQTSSKTPSLHTVWPLAEFSFIQLLNMGLGFLQALSLRSQSLNLWVFLGDTS